MKQILRTTTAFLIIIIAAIIIGTLLLTAVYLIPVKVMEQNMESTAETMRIEGDFPAISSWCLSRLDSYTDATMLLEASTPSNRTALNASMMSDRYIHNDDIPSDVIINIFGNHEEPTGIYSYFRYWHGYLLTLKPILTIADYSEIRVINATIQTTLVIVVCYLLFKKNLKKFILPFVISVLCITPHMSAICLQYSTCYYLLLLGSIAILLFGKKGNITYIFLIIGIATSYFDFLTFPLTSYGFPIVFYLNLNNDQNIKEDSIDILKTFISWLLGYGLMWLGKFAVGWLITGNNIALDAYIEGLYWKEQNAYVINDLGVNIFKVFYRELRSFALNPAIILAIGFAIVLTVIIVKERKNRDKYICDIKTIIPYLIIAILPFIWYSVLLSPSWEHDFFTCKTLTVTTFSGLCMLTRQAFPSTKNEMRA